MKPPVTSQPQVASDAARPGFFRPDAWRFSVARFLGALVLILVASPFIEPLRHGRLIETALMTLVLLSALLAVHGGRRTLYPECQPRPGNPGRRRRLAMSFAACTVRQRNEQAQATSEDPPV